jgi:hypothetical protein
LSLQFNETRSHKLDVRGLQWSLTLTTKKVATVFRSLPISNFCWIWYLCIGHTHGTCSPAHHATFAVGVPSAAAKIYRSGFISSRHSLAERLGRFTRQTYTSDDAFCSTEVILGVAFIPNYILGSKATIFILIGDFPAKSTYTSKLECKCWNFNKRTAQSCGRKIERICNFWSGTPLRGWIWISDLGRRPKLLATLRRYHMDCSKILNIRRAVNGWRHFLSVNHVTLALSGWQIMTNYWMAGVGRKIQKHQGRICNCWRNFWYVTTSAADFHCPHHHCQLKSMINFQMLWDGR